MTSTKRNDFHQKGAVCIKERISTNRNSSHEEEALPLKGITFARMNNFH